MLQPTSSLIGAAVDATDGAVGSLEDLLFDDQAWTVRWAVVNAGSWLTGRSVLVAPFSLGRLDRESGRIGAQLTRTQVERSPHASLDQPVSRQLEETINRHYGWAPYWGGAGAFASPSLAAVPDLYPMEALATMPTAVEAEPTGDPNLRSVAELTGYGIKALDGDLGQLQDFLMESESWTIRYLVVDTGTWWPSRKVLVSKGWIGDVSWSARQVAVDMTRDKIKAAPAYDPAIPLDRMLEEELHARHGRQGYWSAGAGPTP